MSRDSTQNSNHSDTSGQESSEINTETPDYYREYLRRLMAVISNNEGGAVDWLITFIRSGASDRDIFKALLELTADYSSSEPTNRAP
ncbi:hypothetical protein ASPCAL12968 [Aspergillus calidoustus]|uniref:Uncharacterized protein n=1 Tax=Aspergillus calidoustus TaxID=454130 RepID=A0A0U5GIZ9_ASPCI|nr:hypothetical protein ASPCAL12968 [Aspergillus calidoustus]